MAEEWRRDGTTVYALYHRGDYERGKPVMVNRWWASVQAIPKACTPAEAEEIARLIAAAPDLLEALKIVLGQYRLFVGPDDSIANATIAVACSAIVKATEP